MKRKAKAGLAVGAALLIGAAAIPALGHGTKDGDDGWWRGGGGAHGDWSGHGQMMGGDHMGPTGAPREPGMMNGAMMRMMMQHMMAGGTGMPMDGTGMMGHGAEFGHQPGMMGALLDGADADDDGTVSPDELRAALAGKLGEFDADGDGALSLQEFEALHAAMTRAFTVDRFQALDEDGDGNITADEFAAPADRMQRMMEFGQRFGHHAGPSDDMNDRGPGTMMDGDN